MNELIKHFLVNCIFLVEIYLTFSTKKRRMANNYIFQSDERNNSEKIIYPSGNNN